MSLVEIAAQSAAGVRWHVYLAPIRDVRFGENPKAVLRWHVRPYLASTNGANRVHVDVARQFRSLPAALIHARNECRRFYRRTTR